MSEYWLIVLIAATIGLIGWDIYDRYKNDDLELNHWFDED